MKVRPSIYVDGEFLLTYYYSYYLEPPKSSGCGREGGEGISFNFSKLSQNLQLPNFITKFYIMEK